ncbi:MAG: hypothetical protein SOW05_05445 [Candidatus Enterosoma sp.]|nr:hypothetical protein [Candidatus Enterosoma sp.]
MSETNAAVSMGTQAMSALSQTTKVTIDAVAALLAKRDLDGLDSDLLNWVKDGGTLKSNVVIPRIMLQEFKSRAKKENASFETIDTDAQTQWVTIVYKGAKTHKVNQRGELVRIGDEIPGGTVVDLNGDEEKVRKIATDINEKYRNQIKASYEMDSKEFETIIKEHKKAKKGNTDFGAIGDLSLSEAKLLQAQMSEHFIRNALEYNEEKDIYRVIFENEKRELGEFGSSTELAIREAALLSKDEDIAEYIKTENASTKYFRKAIAEKNMNKLNGVTLMEPIDLQAVPGTPQHHPRNFFITFNDNIAHIELEDKKLHQHLVRDIDFTTEAGREEVFSALNEMTSVRSVAKETLDRHDRLYDKLLKIPSQTRQDITRYNRLVEKQEQLEKDLRRSLVLSGHTVERAEAEIKNRNLFSEDELIRKKIKSLESVDSRIKNVENLIKEIPQEDFRFTKFMTKKKIDTNLVRALNEKYESVGQRMNEKDLHIDTQIRVPDSDFLSRTISNVSGEKMADIDLLALQRVLDTVNRDAAKLKVVNASYFIQSPYGKQGEQAQIMEQTTTYGDGLPPEALIHISGGRNMAESLNLDYDWKDPVEPELDPEWHKDENRNHIPDEYENIGDENRNGIPDEYDDFDDFEPHFNSDEK